MKKVLYHWIGFLQDDQQFHNVREVYYLEDNTLYYRSNDSDGETRYYSSTIADFEYVFKINIGELISK